MVFGKILLGGDNTVLLTITDVIDFLNSLIDSNQYICFKSDDASNLHFTVM